MIAIIAFIIAIICLHTSGYIARAHDVPPLGVVIFSIIGGLVLPTIAETMLFKIAWYWAFLINLAIYFILGAGIAKFYLVRMSSGNLAKDMFQTFIAGIIALVIGLVAM